MPKPNTSAATLRRILQQELLIGKRLLELAEEQSDAIIAGDVARLSALELTQRRCVEQQEQLETARIRATRDLAFALGMDRIPTLSALLPFLLPREQEALSQLRVQVLETQGLLDVVNARNLRLLDNALEYVRFSLEMLTTAALKPARYGTNLAQIAAPTFYIDSKA